MFFYVVGYNSKPLIDDGQLISASFLGVGAEGYWVSDLVISGYQEEEASMENYMFGLEFYVLDYAGRTLQEKGKFFSYGDNFDNEIEGEWDGGLWYDYEGNNVESHNPETDTILNPGDAVWLTAPQVSDDSVQYKITTRGSVLLNSISYELQDDGNSIGNPFASPIWVSSIAIEGYQEEEASMENYMFGLEFYVLDYAGRTLQEKGKFFSYGDNFDNETEGEWDGGLWYDYEGEAVEAIADENDAQLQPGDGIWLTAPQASEGTVYNLIFTTK